MFSANLVVSLYTVLCLYIMNRTSDTVHCAFYAVQNIVWAALGTVLSALGTVLSAHCTLCVKCAQCSVMHTVSLSIYYFITQITALHPTVLELQLLLRHISNQNIHNYSEVKFFPLLVHHAEELGYCSYSSVSLQFHEIYNALQCSYSGYNSIIRIYYIFSVFRYILEN